jgi:uncharacterized protein (DUF4415 family)
LSRLDAHKIRPEEYADIPELTEEFFERAEHRVGNKLVRRGRPPLAKPKKMVTLRLDQEVIDGFRAVGQGWQSRINAVLRDHLVRHKDG